ncbi:hypothetical protein [Nocardia sp. NPDC052566]|uniref:hypothetical protein n=1 Tax=Nocardia sp. NPDC052566 TaxID=3364330 RepID=UPI0037C7E583
MFDVSDRRSCRAEENQHEIAEPRRIADNVSGFADRTYDLPESAAMSSDREQLAAIVRVVFDRGPVEGPIAAINLADALLAAGWHPPACVIETPADLALLPTGTPIGSRSCGVGQIDHGMGGCLVGTMTIVYMLAEGMIGECIRDLPPASFLWTVLHTPTEGGTE